MGEHIRKMYEKSKIKHKGFTLVELIIVIAIMAILAGAIAPAMIRYIHKARVARATEDAQAIVKAIETALASALADDGKAVTYDCHYVGTDGNSYECRIITDWILSRIQGGTTFQTTDPKFDDYLAGIEILENLDSMNNSGFRFIRFTGSTANPIGMSCSGFYGTYGCPGIIAAYAPSGKVLFLEYYNYGVFVRYEDSVYKEAMETSFSGSGKLQYTAD